MWTIIELVLLSRFYEYGFEFKHFKLWLITKLSKTDVDNNWVSFTFTLLWIWVWIEILMLLLMTKLSKTNVDTNWVSFTFTLFI